MVDTYFEIHYLHYGRIVVIDGTIDGEPVSKQFAMNSPEYDRLMDFLEAEREKRKDFLKDLVA